MISARIVAGTGGGRCRRMMLAVCGYLALTFAGAPTGYGSPGNTAGGPGPESGANARLCDMTEAELDRLLRHLAITCPDFNERLRILARRYDGCSGYYADPLTRENEDWFPYRHTNCTMYVLYVAALANSASSAQARCHMRRLHYRGGTVSFASRYHFTSDRITDPGNPYFSDCTARSVRDPSRLNIVPITLNRKKDGGFFFGGPLHGWSRRITMSYLPRKGFEPDMLKPLPPVTGVAFVKKENWSQGVFIGHEGLLIDGDLYHSSEHTGVTVVKEYLARVFVQSAWEGIVLFAINPVVPEEPCGGTALPSFRPEPQDFRRALRER
jgi:hypothetical protein